MVDTSRRPPDAGGPAPRRSWTGRRGLTLLMVAMVVVYAPMAMEYTLHLWTSDAPRLWDHTLRATADAEFQEGPRSVTAVQAVGYHQERVWLTLHTTTGGLALLLGIWQFSDRLRRTRPRLHRGLGVGYVAAALVSLTGSAGFMVNTTHGEAEIYNGRPFEAGLWGVWAITFASITASLLFLRAGDIRRHSEFMALSYAGLLTAPVLRLGWVLIARTSSLDQWDANLAFTTSLAPQTVMLAALWRSFRGSARPLRIPNGQSLVSARGMSVLRLLAAFGVITLLNAMWRQWTAPRWSPPELFGGLDLTGDSGVAFAVYALGAGAAMVLGTKLLGSGLRPSGRPFEDPVTVGYLSAVGIGTLGVLLLVAFTGDRMVGGIVGVHYWVGIAIFWVLTTALFVRALLAGDHGRSAEWGLHSVAMSFQSALFHLTYLVLGATQFADVTGRVVTAAILSFAGAVTTAYIAVALSGTPRLGLQGRNKALIARRSSIAR